MQERPGRPFGHVTDLVATVEHQAEGTPLVPTDVVVAFGLQFG